VIDSVLELAADPADPLADLIDPERIAVAGHSLGGLTVLGAAYNSCCRDERVDAVIAAAAVEVPFPDGTYDGRPATPLLVVHGGRDDVIPFDEGAAVFAAAFPPAYFLQLPTADHDSMLVRQNPRYDEDLADITDRTLIAFLDRYLREDADALDGLQASIEATGLATFEERPAG
jgi:predicted dienelactone hydrolase